MSGKKSKKSSQEPKMRSPMEEISTSVEAAEGFMFPDAGAVLTSGETTGMAESAPLPAAMAAKPMEQKSPAEWAYERLILYIQKFEEQLDADHEVAMGFVGGVGSMHVMGMGFFAPDLVTFYGADEAGVKTQMVQHVSQVNLTLKATPKLEKNGEATRIGFLLEKELERKKSA